MKRTKCPFIGPANMKKNYKVKIQTKDGVFTRVIQGFQGMKGWRYHPTKGFRKESGFVPSFDFS